MKLVVALGNPDPKYTQTRHNVGRLVLRQYLSEHNSLWDNFSQLFKRTSVPNFKGELVKSNHLFAPDLGCYMNESGLPTTTLLAYFKIPTENLIVLHDDIDLPLGTIRVSQNSSAGGHNGVKSIIDQVNTQNFTRIRIGIESRSENKVPPTESFVLQKFSEQELLDIKNPESKIKVELDKLLK